MINTILWSRPVKGTNPIGPVVVDNDILIGTTGGLARHRIDGGTVWRSEGTPVGNLLVAGSRVWWADATGRLHVTDVETGDELATAAVKLDGGGLLKVRNQLVVTDNGNVVSLSYADGKIGKTTWSADDWLGIATTPPIAVGGRARPRS